LSQGLFKERLLPCRPALPRQCVVDIRNVGQPHPRRGAMFGKDFLRSRSYIAVMAQGRRERVRLFVRNGLDSEQDHRESDRENAFFAARENAAAEIESAECRVVEITVQRTEIAGDKL